MLVGHIHDSFGNSYARQVTNGITLPLEVRMSGNGKGFGVHCADPVSSGTFIASYIGERRQKGGGMGEGRR